jgi:hypothetical protein
MPGASAACRSGGIDPEPTSVLQGTNWPVAKSWAYPPDWSLTQIYRQEARLVAKIFRGAKPADLPVEQPTKFELVINLQAAKVINHEVPAALVLRADKVIE